MAFIESAEIAAVRVGEHGAIAARDGCAEELPDRRGFAGSRRAKKLEVLGFIRGRDADARQGQWLGPRSASAGAAALFGPPVREHDPAFVRIRRFAPYQPRASSESERTGGGGQNPVSAERPCKRSRPLHRLSTPPRRRSRRSRRRSAPCDLHGCRAVSPRR